MIVRQKDWRSVGAGRGCPQAFFAHLHQITKLTSRSTIDRIRSKGEERCRRSVRTNGGVHGTYYSTLCSMLLQIRQRVGRQPKRKGMDMSGNRHRPITPILGALDTRLSRRQMTRLGAAAATAATLGALPRFAAAQEATPSAYNGEEVTITYGYWDTAQSA